MKWILHLGRFATWINEKTHLASIIVFLILFQGCNDAVTTPETTPISTLSRYEGCKTFADASSSVGSDLHSNNVECIEYEYDNKGLLVLEHINSGFNCCPANITADIVVSGNKINVEEMEQKQGCFCQCLFDVIYEIHELAPGEYRLEVKGLYLVDTDEELRLDVDLTAPCSGTFCVGRTHYPWNSTE